MIRFMLLVPCLTVQLGPVTIDPLKAVLGYNLADVLAPLSTAPPTVRQEGAKRVTVHNLAIPEGDNVSIPIPNVGELGFRAQQGFLILLVPFTFVEAVRAQLAPELGSNQAFGPRMTDRWGEFAVRLRPGMRKALPLGTWGEFGVEVA